MQGIVGTGVCFYLQTWCVDMKGPVFLAMWYPMSLLLTVLCSSLLGETTHLGRHSLSLPEICISFHFKLLGF